MEQTLAGIKVPNPIGLAAGFDKDAEALNAWETLGFGFVEVGTVTPSPQAGNPKPRLFRVPQARALINRMGFNSIGADLLGDRLRAVKVAIPVGVNIGINRDTPPESAAEAYADAVIRLCHSPSYFVINVSSPNTPGLRDLQDPQALAEIIDAVRHADGKLPPHNRITPLFVKVSPDLEEKQLESLVDLALRKRLDGLVATNTTLSREGVEAECSEEGGLSGEPLFPRSIRTVRMLRRLAGDELIIIGVGGVTTVERLIEMMYAGANLVQLYTGLVYEGPRIVKWLCRGLRKEITSAGANSMEEFWKAIVARSAGTGA